MSETPRTGDRVRWTRQIAIEGTLDDVTEDGYRIRDRDGRVHLCQTEDASVEVTERRPTTAEDGADYVFRSKLRGDGAAFLSLHRNGDDVHLRLRHVSSEPLAFEVAVLSPYERRALITALSEFDAEPPARKRVEVPNEPHGLSHEDRVKIGAFLAAGHKASATVIAMECGLSREDADAYLRDMEEYQTYLAAHGRTEVDQTEADRMRAMGFDKQPEFKLTDEQRAEINDVLTSRRDEFYGGLPGEWRALHMQQLSGVVADIVFAAIRRDRERGDR